MRQHLERPATAVLAIAVASALTPARAQQTVDKVERIEVTGSRLTSSNVESASPIVTIKAEDLRTEGYQQIELILANYPQIFIEQGNRTNNGATGTSTISLRGLGANRTLTLVNGKRLPPGSPAESGYAADVNQIAAGLIQRVEILTGGASAVYGSDAIAGVVNFILNDHFEGVQGSVNYDFYNHQQQDERVQALLRQRKFAVPGDKSNDGATTGVNLLLGGNFAQDKGNATVAFRYLKVESLLQSERDYSACNLAGVAGTADVACAGSTTSYPGRWNQGRGRDFMIDPGTGQIRAFNMLTDLYNFAPVNYFQRPAERYGFNAFAHYDVSPSARVYGEFAYTDDHTVYRLAPSGLFKITADIHYENPLLTDEWRSMLRFVDPDTGAARTGPGSIATVQISRRNVEGGGRVGDIRHSSFREVLGVKGTTPQDWDYDVYFQTARVNYQYSATSDFSSTRALRTLDVVTDPATGRPACAAAVSGVDRGCVPYNIWTLGGVTQAALDYLQVPGFERGFTSQQIAGATITSDLGKYGLRFPRAKSAVEVAFGVERRMERLDFETDATLTSGDLTGFPTAVKAVAASVETKDIFTELRMPVLDSLNLTGSYRRSSYRSDKATNTYGAGFNASPWSAVRFRGSIQRAVRAPDIRELYTPRTPGPGFFVDTCAGDAPASSPVECARTGVTASRYGKIPEAFEDDGNAALQGGYDALKPETAKTYTLGIAFTPMRNLALTVDYYDIRIDDYIAAVDPALTFDECLRTGEARFCSRIVRDPAFGTLWMAGGYVDGTGQNIGRVRAAGVDVAVNYNLRLAGGHSVLVDGMGTYATKVTVQTFAGAPEVECVGWFNADCGTPTPRWRHRLRATWQTPWKFDAAATWRYLSESRNLDPADAVFVPLIRAMSYLDLAATWYVNKTLTFRVGVNNVLDTDPPVVNSGTNGNTVAQGYDALGRHVFVGLTARF